MFPSRLLACATAIALVVAGLLAGPLPPATAAAPGVTALRTNSFADPLGVRPDDVSFSWQLASSQRNVRQTAYEVRVASDASRLSDPDVWDSGKVDSSEQVAVAYGGPPLDARTRYTWSARVWDGTGAASDWSEPATFETALAHDEAWTGAQWIGADTTIPKEWSDYTVTFHAKDISAALGLFVRAADGRNSYMWQFSQAESALRPHVRRDGAWRVLGATAMPGFDFTAQHEYSVTVAGNTITTKVDVTVIDTRTDATLTGPGLVGFRTSGNEKATILDATIVSATGATLLKTSFPDGDTSFSAGSVADGTLALSGDTESYVTHGLDVPLLRKEFDTKPLAVAEARIYATARGVYELSLNGQRVGDHELAPGWTDYRKRIQYQTYDVTKLLRDGKNVLGGQVAEGWFAGRVAMFGDSIYGADTSLLARLHVHYTDGTEETVGTDGTWRTTDGPITAADLLDGERHDARRAAAVSGWDSPGFDAAAWRPVVVRASPTAALEAQIDPPARVTEQRKAQRIDTSQNGPYIYDLGQNMVGHVRVRLAGQPGTTARIRVAEVLNPDGTLYTENYRSARATDHYTFATPEPETWEPKFTFHGFRYVEITGVTAAPSDDDINGIVVGTDNTPTSRLVTSSALVNQLQSNIVWGQRGNFLSIPTDTPARDERMGWTGDINVFSNTAVYNADTEQFLDKWLVDLRDAQDAKGGFPGVAPIVPGRFDGGFGSAGWADAGVHVPVAVWRAYGDRTILEDNYEAMKRYVDFLASTSTDHIRNVGGYGDWLNLDDDTPAAVIDTAFVAKSTKEFAEVAQELGRTEDATAYQARYEAVRTAFQKSFIDADGKVRGDSQTAYILTIMNDLAPAELMDKVASNFVATLARRDYHLSTGFLGVDGLLPALTRIGRQDISYRLLQNTEYPSWGYEISKGATTVWERWNSIMPDGSFGPVGMNSFNHYAYGAVGEWMYRTMAGVSAMEPGYRKVLVAPTPGKGIDWVNFELDTRLGTVRSAWKVTDNTRLTLDVTVPANMTAEVRVPTTSRESVTEGGKPAESVPGISFLGMADGVARYEVPSGSYAFASPVQVSPPVTVESVKASPDTAHPGDTIAVATVLRNGSATEQRGQLRLTGPDGWESRTLDYILAPGASAAVEGKLAVPQTVVEGPNRITASVGTSLDESESTTVGVEMQATDDAWDHVDLGNDVSEKAHSLTASEFSGTSTEAGLTRRYTHTQHPGGWYEFTVNVKPGQPFLIRSTETYDRPIRKTYDVVADGRVVHERRFNHQKAGASTVTYQFVVDDEAISADGKVKLRMQDVPGDGDASIADVWVLPVPARQPDPSPSPTASPSPSPTASPSPAPTPTRPAQRPPYEVPGFHLINDRWWYTTCGPYSQTIRCRTEIWSKQVVLQGGKYVIKQGWFFNNLTYLPFMTRAQWGSNPLAKTGQWTNLGRKYKTECDTAVTGKGACRSFIWGTRVHATPTAPGKYTYKLVNGWVFNNLVRFKN